MGLPKSCIPFSDSTWSIALVLLPIQGGDENPFWPIFDQQANQFRKCSTSTAPTTIKGARHLMRTRLYPSASSSSQTQTPNDKISNITNMSITTLCLLFCLALSSFGSHIHGAIPLSNLEQSEDLNFSAVKRIRRLSVGKCTCKCIWRRRPGKGLLVAKRDCKNRPDCQVKTCLNAKNRSGHECCKRGGASE